MGFRNAQPTTDKTDKTARSTSKQSMTTQSTSSEQSTPEPSMMGQIWPSIERAEEHFGMQIPDESTLQRLEDHERAYGRETHEWIAEGMPTDIMGSPKSMEAFRQRQADRPPEVPTNIERQNRRSVLRSQKAAGEMSPAGETGVPDPVRDVISSTGRSLDGSIQRAMEDRMGDSFGDVRIHTGSTAAEACESINARAFTVGNHIAFNSGEYDPSSPEGQHVLAHELAHVRQQTQGAVSMLPQENMELEVDPNPALEREAEETAQRVMEGGKLGVPEMGDTEVQVQRMSADESAAYYEAVIDAIREKSQLGHDDIDRIKDEVAEGVAGTGYAGSIGHDELNIKQLQKASEAAAQKANSMKTIKNAEASFADKSSTEMMEVAQADLEADANMSGQIAEMTNGELSAMDVVHENAKTEREYPEALEEIYELEAELQSILADGDVRLTDAQADELQSVKQDIAETFDSQKAEIAITYLTNLLTNQTMGAGLSGLLAEQMGTAEASAASGAVIMAISMGLAALAQTMADYYTEPDDDTGSETDKVDY